MLPTVLILTALYNRHNLMERTLASFIEQDYEGKHILFIYNTGKEQSLDNYNLPENKQVILVNNTKDLITGEDYKSVGEKYRDALIYCSSDYDIINFVDSDDFMLPSHISEGVKGIERAHSQQKVAYKPKYSFMKGSGEYKIAENVFEGSIFMDSSHIKNTGFLPATVTYHNGWLHPLIRDNAILVDKTGPSTWVYTWGEEFPTFKTSGGQDNYQNFISSQKNSMDVGDKILTPWPKETMSKLYSDITNFHTNFISN